MPWAVLSNAIPLVEQYFMGLGIIALRSADEVYTADTRQRDLQAACHQLSIGNESAGR